MKFLKKRRKIIVDTYGGYAHYGGGAFSGKDGTKVDGSASYYIINKSSKNGDMDKSQLEYMPLINYQQIVLNAEQKVNFDYNIKDVHVNLDIAQMNGDAYLRLQDYELYKKQYYGKIGEDFKYEDYTRYRTENLIRRTWMVTIECDEISKKGEPIDKYYTYHVDATTGEITGGSPIYYLLKIQNS